MCMVGVKDLLKPLRTLLAKGLLEEQRNKWLTASATTELPLPCSYQGQDFDPSFDEQTLVVSLSSKLQRHLDIGEGDRARAYEFFYVIGRIHEFLFGFNRLGKYTLALEVHNYLEEA